MYIFKGFVTLRFSLKMQDHKPFTQPHVPLQHALCETFTFCLFYIYINKIFKFKIHCSILRCQTLKKYLPSQGFCAAFAAHCDPFDWTDWFLQMGTRGVAPLQFQGDLLSKTDPAEGPKH